MKKQELEELKTKELIAKENKATKTQQVKTKKHKSLAEEEQIIEDKLNDEILDLKEKTSWNNKWFIATVIIAIAVGTLVGCLFGFGVI